MASPTVFIIDDDPSVRRALSRLVRSAGLASAEFESPLEFLEKASVSASDCLVLDVRMPLMGGIELRKRLKMEKREVPTIFMTAFPSRDVDEVSVEEGVVGVLYKPFDADDFLAAIAKAVG